MKFLIFLCNFLRIGLTAVLFTAQVFPADDLRPPSAAVNLLIQKARSLEARDRQDLAAQVWQQLLVTDPNQPDALAGLARWAKRSGRNEEANAYLSRLRRVAPDSPALVQSDAIDTAHKASGKLDEAAILAANSHFEEAMKIYREVFGTAPPSGGWAVAYYQTLANTAGGFEPAVSALKKLAALYPDVPAYQVAAGKLMTYRPASRRPGIELLSSVSGSTGAASQAREAWRQALIWEKSNPAYLPFFEAYLARYADPELLAASTALRGQTARLEPLSSDSREEQLGYQALKNGSLADAEHEFKAALEKNPASERAHAGLGFVRMKTGDFDDAVRQFEAAHQSASQDVTIRNSLEAAKFWQAMRLGAKSAEEDAWTDAVAHYRVAIALRPNDLDANRALGGALLAAGSPNEAIPYLTKVVRAKPHDDDSWCALASSKLNAEGGASALAFMHSAPEALAATLNRSIEWRALEAAAYADGVDDGRARELYRQLIADQQASLTPKEQIQLAGLALHFHDPDQALLYARKAVEAAGDQPGAWEVLLPALLAAGRSQEAERVYTLMPAQAQKVAMTHASFLETLASLTEAGGDLDGARKLLEQSIALAATSPRQTEQISIKLHLAQLLAKQGRGAEAATAVAALTEMHPQNVAAWRARLLILQTLDRQNDIVSVSASIPHSVAPQLAADGDMVTLLARAQASAGDPELGIKMLEAYLARDNFSNSPDSLPERIQLGWLLLNSPTGGSRLYAVLDDLQARKDLNTAQRKEVTNLWTTWILRSAETARQSGDEARALSLLQQGSSMFPNNLDLERGLAGNLLAAGKTKAAFAAYSNWGLAGAQAADYAGAIAAALAEHNTQYADAWIDRALGLWPHDPKVLELAGEGAQSHGDLKRAEKYWKEALAQRQSQSKDQATASGNPGESSLKTLLVGSSPAPGNPGAAQTFSPSPDQPSPQLQLSSFHGVNAPQPQEDFVRPSSTFVAEARTQPSLHTSYLANAMVAPAAPVDSLADKLAAVESVNTPYLGSGMSVWGRDGEAGFSRLLIQQSQFEASRTLSDSLRVSFLLLPTYLSGGTASGSGVSLFGRQTSAASFGPQNANGVSAEAQLSSQSVGIRLGISPQGFLTHNWIGGFRLQPKNGPITILLERDSVKDTLLAYAGARDPITNEIWGGVMANTASIQGRWGNERSGVYVSGGYQVVEGRNVLRNTGVNANLGTWWKVAALPSGSLTVGMNFSAMHYENNLRYFTFGQGGYFSPQQYFLFSAPVRWTGTYGRRVQYIINGSLGAQHFVEDASDFYPTDAALQAATGYRYQALVSTGANFNFNARLDYQMAPHWILGAFATANNARNYTAASAGVFAKYTFEERPMSFDNALPSVPDWRGQQPFLLY
ncbi:MAG TPA: cellulose synthase subunit BcsC-related outer membrane protein [Bryobacteraceae bacterium]